jgi:glycosyltransferase involved in cell wall biosynthesis
MRIAQVPPLYEAVPPRFYGGTERVVAHLTDALVDLGHDVTLFASGDAQHQGRTGRGARPGHPPGSRAAEVGPGRPHGHAGEVRRQAHRFDVIHFHTDMIQFPMFEDMAAKTLTTLHGRLDLKDLPGVYRRWPQFPLVSISDDQRQPLPFANWAGTVLHGMAEEIYDFHPKSEGYLAFLGRISPEKGPDRAIAIAKRLGKKLKIAAKIDAPTSPISTTRSSPDGPSADRVRRRDRRPSRSPPSWAAPMPCCSRSPGPSRSAW